MEVKSMFHADIFISYKNDNAGNNFAKRIRDDLDRAGFSVYFNPEAQRSNDFVDRLHEAVIGCKDFVLIVSQGCINQLLAHEEEDYIRFELLTAHESGKKITPIIMDGVKLPSRNDFPNDLKFFADIDNVQLPEDYQKSPFESFVHGLESKPEKNDVFRDVFNSNSNYNILEDFSETKKRAEAGNYTAMYELANMYFYGLADDNGESDRSFAKAFYWFKKMSEDGSDLSYLADSMIAKMYYRGIVPREEQSYEKALSYHLKASEKSGYSAQQAAYMLSTGMGCEFDFKVAEQKYESIIDQGDNIAFIELARFYTRLGKLKEAAKIYLKICNIFPEAEFQLGMLYKNGIMNENHTPDYYRAAFHFQHVISLGNCSRDVYYELGLLYFKATGGFIKDFKTAQDNFIIAADMGHVEAQYLAGYMYEHGHIEKNIPKAIYYHKLAADQGHPLSPTHLAILYQLSECRNYHQAFKYAQMAANLGEKEGEYVLGNLLYLGRGCVADEDRAYEMYNKAYAHGVDQAKFMLDKITEYHNRD